jgi:hypothetical protein
MVFKLRSTITFATAALPDANVIVDRNLNTMITLGHEGWNRLQSQLKQSIKSSS